MSPHHSFLRSRDQQDSPPASPVSAEDNIFRLGTPPAGPAGAAPGDRTWPTESRRVNPPAALDMLNRAAKAMDLLQSRYHHVETYAKDVADRAEKDISAAYAQARDWEARATSHEAELAALRARAVDGERRAEEAERRAEHAERRAEQAEREANEARDWLQCFYDKIVVSFDMRSLLKSQAA